MSLLKRYRNHFALCLALLSSSRVQAAPVDLFDLSLDELMTIPVSVATKSDAKFTTIPSSVSVFDRARLDALDVHNLIDLFEVIPGFYAMYNPVEGNQSYLITRGHSQKYAANVLVLVNGQRLNDDYTGGVTYLNRFMSLKFAKRIEVIRGPGSALYGSNAINGVINIITDHDGAASVALQSFGGKEISVANSFKHNELSLGFGIHGFADEGANIDVSYDRFNQQQQTQDAHSFLHLDTRLKWRQSEFQFLHYQSQRDDYYLFRRLRDGVANIELAQSLLGYKQELIQSQTYNLSLYAEYNRAERQSITALALQNSVDLPDADYLFGEDFLYESYRAGIDYRQDLNPTFSLGTGIEWFSSEVPEGYLQSNYDLNDQYLGSVQTLKDETARAVMDKTREMVGIYAQLEYHSGALSGVFGLRYDDYNDTQDKLSPRLSSVYEYDAHNVFKAIYSEAFRSPSLGDLYDKESGLTDGNENLKAPKIHSTELSYQYLEDNWHMDMVFFYNDIENLIGFVDDEGTVRLQNAARASSYGFEISATWLWSHWKQEFAFTHLLDIDSNTGDSSLTANENLSPKTYGYIQSQYRINESNHMSAKLLYRDDVDIIESDSGLALLSASYDIHLTRNQNVHLSADNILDEKYEVGAAVPLNAEGDDFYQAYPMRGRVWRLEYEINY